MSQATACVIGSTVLVIECADIIQQHGISIEHVFTDDQAVFHWATKQQIATSSQKAFLKFSNFSQFDYLFSIVNDTIVRKNILGAFRKLCINYHDGPLPKYSGVGASQWALLNGETEHGISWHIMEAQVDSGLVLEQVHFQIEKSDDVFSVNMKCRKAALSALKILCSKLKQGKWQSYPQKLDMSTKHMFESKPSAFCMLPFHKKAVEVKDFFRGTFTLGKLPQVNLLGLPKLFLPTEGKIVIVGSLEISSNSSKAKPGTVVKDDNHNALHIATNDNDVIASDFKNVDGTPFMSQKSLLGVVVGNPSAHNEDSSMCQLSKLAAKYEHAWTKKLSKTKPEPPMLWPYRSFNLKPISEPILSNSESSNSYSEEQLALITSQVLSKLKCIEFNVSPDILALGAFLTYVLVLSPTLSSGFDIYCNNIPEDLSCYVLRTLPISLKLEPNESFQECLSAVVNNLTSVIVGNVHQGIRHDLVSSDVYLRYPGIISELNNVFGITTNPENVKSPHCRHEVIVVSTIASDENGDETVLLKAMIKNISKSKYVFCSFADDFEAFITSALVDPNSRLAEIPLVNLQRLEQINEHLTGNTIPRRPRWVHESIEESAKLFPHVTATVDDCLIHTTYGEIVRRSCDIAYYLKQTIMCENSPELRVALLLGRTCETISAMLAVLKLGGCFVMMESCPSKHLAHVIESCQLHAVLVNADAVKTHLSNLEENVFPQNVSFIYTDTIPPAQVKLDPDHEFQFESSKNPTSDGPAIIVSTSGTTGKPKSVVLKHSSISNYVAYIIERFNLQRTKWNDSNNIEVEEVSLACTSFNFDGSLHDILPILWLGGTLYFHPLLHGKDKRWKSIQSSVTFFFTQPIKLPYFDHERFCSLRNLSVGGESFSLEMIQPWFTPTRKVWNIYGPCETTIGCSVSLVTNKDKISLGNPISNVVLQILNPLKQPVPNCVPGELHIGGAGVSLMYTDADLNKGAFWMDSTGTTFYKTSDLVVLESGKLHFLSRIPKSQEVKLHGIRIELSGVKNVINQIPGVIFSHVEVDSAVQNKPKLVVYIATKSSTRVSTVVRKVLKRELSSFNVPIRIIPISESDIPSTPAGKLDLKKLTSTWSNSFPAETEEEELVLESYRKSLELDDDTQILFGMESDFFEFGGNSIAVVSLAEELSALLNKSVLTNDVLESQTPKRLLEAISRRPSLFSPDEINVTSSSRKLSYFQEALISNNALQVGPTYNLPYVLRISGNIDSLRINVALEVILSHLHSAYKQNIIHSGNHQLYAKGNTVRHVNYSSYKSDGESKAMSDIQLDSVLPINFKVCPFRCTVYSVSNDTIIVSIVLHHLVFDQQTLLNIDRALTHLYQDSSTNLPDIEPYSYFISYEEQRTKNSGSSSQTFWKNLLNGVTPFVDFPTTFARTTSLKYHGNTIKCTLSPEILSEVFKFCAQNKVSQPSLFLATYGLMIHRLSHPTQSFAVGCTMSLRSSVNSQLLRKKFQTMFGIAVNVLPCIFPQAELEKSPNDLINHVSRWFHNAMKHTWYPFSELVKLWCGESEAPLRLPQFLFNFLSMTQDRTLEMGEGVCVQRIDVHTYTAKAELLLEVTATKKGIFEVSLEYNTGLFSRHMATEILNEYCALLRDIICSNELPLIQSIPNISQQMFAAHFHHSAINDCKLTKYQHAIYKCQIPLDQLAQFHSSFSLYLNADFEPQNIVKILEQFPQLALTICRRKDDVYMTVREGTQLQLQFEYARGSEEVANIKSRLLSWPTDIHSTVEPLFRCSVIENLNTEQRELFCVSHCMLLDELCLNNLVNQLLEQLQMSKKLSTSIPYIGFLKEAQQDGTDLTKHPLVCDKSLLPLQIYNGHLPQHLSSPTVRKFHFKFNLQILPEDYVPFCCSLSALLLGTLQQSSHIHFALQCPEKNISLTSNEVLLPVCVNLDSKASFGDMISAMKSRLSSIHAKVLSEKFFYWDTSVDVNPFTCPLHEMLVKILPSAVPSNHATVSYPQRFSLCVTFHYNSGEILLQSLLGHKQTKQAQKCFDSLIQSFQPTNITRNITISELKLDYTPSVLKANLQCEDTDADLSNQVLQAFKEHKHQLLFCEPSSQLDNERIDLLFTYEEVKRLACDLSKEMVQATENDSMIGILVEGGVTLPVCMLAATLNDQCFTVFDAAANPSIVREKLSTLSISLILVDVQSLNILEEMFDLIHFPLIIVDPYLGELSWQYIPCNVYPIVTSATTSDSVAESSFLVFTSGSTGIPKPVPVLKKSLVNFLEWFKVCAFENSPLRVLHYSGHSFDVLVSELLVQFLCGGTLILTDTKFKLDIKGYTLPLMVRYSIEAIYLVPTVISLMLHSANFSAQNLPHLKHVLSTGEKLETELCRKFFLHFHPGRDKVILHNWGGPSECCIGIAHCKVNKESSLFEIPYGYLIPRCEAMVCGLDSRMPVPLGYAGEVLVSGTPVFDGYIGTPRNIQTPFTYIDGKKWYCTGDIAIINHKGQLVYLQRLDKQVKISGQRVNLGGVRSQILRLNLPYLQEIVVLNIDQHLLCFPLVSAADSEMVDELTVQRDFSIHLAGKLIPTVVKCMTQYPMLSSHKIDHKKLKEIAQHKLSRLEHKNAHPEVMANDVTEKFVRIIKKINPYLSSIRLSLSLDELGFTSIDKVQFYEELLTCEEFKHLSLDSVLVARNLQELINKANFQSMEKVKLSSPLNMSNILSVKETASAIIGMHVQVAGASNIEEFWNIIEQKRETIIHNIPIDKQTELEQKYGGAQYIGSRGLLQNELCKGFDARLFGISDADATIMDPQQRVLLQAVWNALEIAGYDPIRFAKRGSIGVFAGTEFPSYLFNVLDTKSGQPSDQIVWQNLRDNVALRISREFDCKGPCVSVANNCSTFMVALHLAHRSLLLHECDMAIVATATISGRRAGYLTTSKDIFSKDGHCRPFSSTASGTVMSDGVAVVILRRLNDARADEDDIECLIRSTSIGCDGSLAKERQLTPSSVGQANILKNATKNVFGDVNNIIDFSSIGLIEAHGTGTTAGDQVEIESFKKVSQNTTAATPIGSIKGNIGHTGVTSAGPALIKAALALKKAKIPPSINCSDPSAHIKRTNFYVNTEMKEWISPSEERRVLVHSIGAMGSNGAAILEQYDSSSNEHRKTSSSETDVVPFPVCISANSEHSLNELLARLERHLTNLATTVSLNNLAYTLLFTRRFLPLRVAHMCSTKKDLTKWLSSSVLDVSVSRQGKLCCTMFSGQGALIHPKSLRILSKVLPKFKDEICNCFKLLKEVTSDSTYSSLIQFIQLNGDSTTTTVLEDIERKLAKSARLQTTVIVSAQIALYHSLEYLGLKSDCFVGHSLGEYTAAHLAGVFSIKDVLLVVYERGKMIESHAQRGEMLSISASPDEIKEMCLKQHKGVQVSCLNSPRHCVASGMPTDIGPLSVQLTSQGIYHKKLQMEYAYHHPSMKVIQERFSTVLKNTTNHALTGNLITTTEGQVSMHTAGTSLPTDYWLQHLVTPCDFLSTVSDCLSVQCRDFVFVELGLVPTLVHFVKACNTELRSACVSVSTQSRDDKGIQKLETSLLTDLTNIWKLGLNVELHKLPCFETAKRIKLPLYPFDKKQYWKEPNVNTTDVTPATNPTREVKDRQPVTSDAVLEVIRKFTGPDYDHSLPVDSLLLVSLENKLFNCFGVSVACNHDTDPHELADYIVSQCNVARNIDPEVTVKLLSPSNDEKRPNIFIINAVDKKRHSFVPLATMFSPHFNVYGLYAPTTIFKLNSIEDYTQLYLKEIRKIQPHGRFILGGFSFGAWVAHSIVHTIECEGKELPTIVFLIDPPQFNPEDDHFSSKLSSLISLGLGSVRTFTNSPVKDTIIQYGNRFQEETKILTNYQISPRKVKSPGLIFLAMERMAFAYEQSDNLSIKEYWSKWFVEDTLKIKTVPGHHGNCFSSFNGEHIVRDVLQALLLPIETTQDQQPIPVCSPDEVVGEWRITNISHPHDSCFADITEHRGVLHLSNEGRYVCMNTNLLHQMGESNTERIMINLLNSCGTFEAMSEPGNFKFTITFSHHISDMPQPTVQTNLCCFNNSLIIKVDTYEITCQGIKHKS